MARECEICGKGPQLGNQVTTRGKAKYLGGVGTKITGITRRQFRPNLQRVRITTPQRQSKTVLVCTKCLKSGAVTKRVKAVPFRLPNQPKQAAGEPKAAASPKGATKAKASAGKAKAAAK